MNSYRKSDQEYYDQYDQMTISILKEIHLEESKLPPRIWEHEGRKVTFDYNPFVKYNDAGVQRSRNREARVKQMILEDEHKDDLVSKHKQPQGLKCDICNAPLQFSDHFFDYKGVELLFIFDCQKKDHKGRKIVYPNGDPFIRHTLKCSSCGGELVTKSERTDSKLIFTETCKSCKKATIDEFDNSPYEAITEEDRKKYVTDFVGRTTFMEDFKSIGELGEMINRMEKEEKIKEKYKLNEIVKLTIPQLKEAISAPLINLNFSNLKLEKPILKAYVKVEFSIEDASNRDETESKKLIIKTINKLLLKTNWRHQKEHLSYRMGYLTGSLIGYDKDEDLVRLAKEIMKPKIT